MMSKIFVFFLFLLSARAEVGVYEEIYPRMANFSLLDSVQDCDPDTSPDGTCPLFFGLLSSLGGIYKTSGCIPAVQMALDEINKDPFILPGYSLHYTFKDSQCNRQVAQSSFFSFVLQPPVKIGILGGGCSVATEPTAELAHYFNLTQISYVSSSPLLVNRIQFKTYFQLLASESNLAYGYYGLIRKFRWRKVAIIGQTENLFTKVNDLLTQQLRGNNVSYTEVRFSSSEGIASLEDRLFDPEARIFVISMYSSQAIEVLCKAYAEEMYYPRYQFIFPGWYDDNWWIGSAEQQMYLMEQYQCNVADRVQVLEYSFTIGQNEFLTDYSVTVDSGITGTTFYDQYNKLLAVSPFGNESIIYAQQGYDATWTLARALNKTMTDLAENETLRQYLRQFNSELDSNQSFGLQDFTYNNSAMLDLMFQHLTRTDFIGLSGHVQFNEEGIKIVETTLVKQYRRSAKTGNLGPVRVASNNIGDPSNITFWFEEGVDIQYLWPHGLIPYDGTIIHEHVTVHFSVTVVYSVLATAGLIVAIICTIFNLTFRNRKLMKLSSPNLNYLIGTGAVVLYINMYIYLIPSKDITAVSVLCNIYPWLASVGYSLCYGTVVMKMGRIFYIFNNAMSTSPKKAIHDWMLAMGVIALVTIDVAILTIFSVVSRNELMAVSIQNRENPEDHGGADDPLGIVTRYHIYVCDSTARNIAINVTYGIKALLQVVALIFAFSIRKVNIKGLDDSPFIIAAIYSSSVVLAVVFISSITLKDYANIYAIVFCTGYFIGTTMVLLLVFVPKMVGIYKDPHGTSIFKNPHSELTSPSHKVKKELGRACHSAINLRSDYHAEICNKNGTHAPMKRTTTFT